MKKRTDSIKKQDFTVLDFSIAADEKILATFTLESGGITVERCACFYTPKGNLEFRLPELVDFERNQEDPQGRITGKLLSEIEKIKASRPDWNVYFPF
jgi:hypothetical protein